MELLTFRTLRVVQNIQEITIQKGHNMSNEDCLGEFSHLVSKLVSNQSVTWDNVVQELPAMVIETFMGDSHDAKTLLFANQAPIPLT